MNELIRQGDAVFLLLNFTVRTSASTTVTLADFVANNNVTEIELTIGDCMFTLTGGDIALDESFNMYYVKIPQTVSFDWGSITRYQLRLKRGSFLVCSSTIYNTIIGNSLSKEVI